MFEQIAEHMESVYWKKGGIYGKISFLASWAAAFALVTCGLMVSWLLFDVIRGS